MIARVTNCKISKIPDHLQWGMNNPFSKEDIEMVVKGMGPYKAPGPDGVHAMFYQKYWDIVGQDTMRICLRILNEGENVGPLNKTLISLIPKVKKPKHLSEFRPISLCNVSYKIIAKYLVNRLKRALNEIIAPTQSAFVLGRMITDNAILGFKCLHAISSKRVGKDGWVALKLGMSKAYDTVEWPFLRAMLLSIGLDRAWVRILMRCVVTVQCPVLINCKPHHEFVPQRGLRQGDPLSPYLFLICTEGLSALLHREESLSLIHGIRLNRHCLSLSHLFFLQMTT